MTKRKKTTELGIVPFIFCPMVMDFCIFVSLCNLVKFALWVLDNYLTDFMVITSGDVEANQ